MGNPYPAEQAQLRRLTAKGKATLQELNDRDESKMDELRQVRADLMAEVVSVDDVMADLRESIDRRKAKMCGDVISLLPADPHTSAQHHAEVYGGMQEFGSVPDLSPDPDKNMERIGELHDAQDARKPPVEL